MTARTSSMRVFERRDARWTVRHADAAPLEVGDAAE
jgi:hypothetical protein